MTRVADRVVVGGVDTHKEIHVAAAVDGTGRILGTKEFATTPAGHKAMLRWWARKGRLARVGVEGTGAYGAGLARFLAEEGVDIVEVDRPNRQLRRRRGKSDPVDAEAAARAALSGEASGAPKARNGNVEMIRALRVARRSAIKARAQATNQMHALVATAPDSVREPLRGLSSIRLVERCARFRPGDVDTPEAAIKLALLELARRHQSLTQEIKRLDGHLDRLVAATSPGLVARFGVSTDTAGALLVAAGDNPGRLRSESSFAALCGVSPVQCSSGQLQRHRLNRGGDRAANQALWRIVMVRLAHDPRTRHYMEMKRKQGRSKKEVIRCLKRYVAREVFADLSRVPDLT
jgi:transposase